MSQDWRGHYYAAENNHRVGLMRNGIVFCELRIVIERETLWRGLA